MSRCISGFNDIICSTVKPPPPQVPQLLSVFSIWTGSRSSSCRKLPPEEPVPQTGGFTSCPRAWGVYGSQCPPSHSPEHCTALGAIGGTGLSSAAELPGKEFPATADPSLKTAFQGITLSPSLQTSSAFPSKSLARGHVCSNRSRADPWEHPGLELVFSKFTARGSYLH